MQKQDFESEQQDIPVTFLNQMDDVIIKDLADEFQVARNTVAKIAKELSIEFKYEKFHGAVRAYVYGDEADKIRRVLDKRYNGR